METKSSGKSSKISESLRKPSKTCLLEPLKTPGKRADPTLKTLKKTVVFLTFWRFGRFWEPGATGKHLGGFSERLGGILGRLGGVLGASWGRLGASWGVLRTYWGVFGAFWGVLGRLRCVFGTFLGAWLQFAKIQ